MILLQLDPDNILVQSGETLNVYNGILSIPIQIPADRKVTIHTESDSEYEFDIPDSRRIFVDHWLQCTVVYLWYIHDSTYYNDLVLQSLSRTRKLSPLQNKLMYEMYFYKFGTLTEGQMIECHIKKNGVLCQMFAAMTESMYIYWFNRWCNCDGYTSRALRE